MASFTWKGFASGQWGEAALWAGVLDGRGYTTAQALAVLPGFDPASGSDYLYIVAV